jgi:hypothetical protein
MPRPRHADRDQVHEHNISLRLSEREKRLLERLVEARRAELLDQTGEHVLLSAASIIRSMILREAKARGLDQEDTPRAKLVRANASYDAPPATKPARKRQR